MTKKHFKLITEIIAKIKNPQERRLMAEHNAKICSKANSRFNSKKFFEACNVEIS